MKNTTLENYLAAQIRMRRTRLKPEEKGLQEDLALRARQFGFPWMRDTVAALETAKRKLTIGEFLFLPQILDITNFSDLFSGDEIIEIGPGLSFTADSIRTLFSQHRRLKPHRQPSLSLVTKRLADANATENNVAKKLGVKPSVVAAIAQTKWRCSLTRWRDIRASREGQGLDPRSLQAKKGIIMRELIEEIRKEVQSNSRPKTRKTRKH